MAKRTSIHIGEFKHANPIPNASRIGNLAEIVQDGENGQLVAPGDIEEWSRVLTDLAHRPSTIDRWRRALRQPRTMDDIAAGYLVLYAA